MSALMIVAAHIVFEPDYTLGSEELSGEVIFLGQLVYLFMILSAFGMCCGYYDRFLNNTVDLRTFYSKRYKRIFPFFAILVMIELAYTFAQQHFDLNEVSVGAAKESFANLTLTFGLLPNAHQIGIVGVGWFLGLIFLFYMLFPFFVYLIADKRRAWFAFGVSIAMSWLTQTYFSTAEWVAVPNWRDNMLVSAPYFLMGGLMYLYRHQLIEWLSGKHRWMFIVAVMAYTLAFFALKMQGNVFLVAVLFGLWAILAVTENPDKMTFLNNKLFKFLSIVSFEIYLCHMMFLRAVGLLHLEKYVGDGDLKTIVTYVCVIVLAVAFASVYKRFESKYIK